jgi:thymidylate synthase ThyX
MAGTLRSWIHYIDVRAEEGTQKEHREVAIAAREEILKHFPSLEEYWFPPEVSKDKSTKVYDGLEVYDPSKKPWWKFW